MVRGNLGTVVFGVRGHRKLVNSGYFRAYGRGLSYLFWLVGTGKD